MISLISSGACTLVRGLGTFGSRAATRLQTISLGKLEWTWTWQRQVCALSAATVAAGTRKFGSRRFSGISSVVRWCSNHTGAHIPPKRPLSAYMHFAKEQQPILLKQNPGVRIADLTKIIAQTWRELPTEQKERYEAASDADKLKYKEDMANFKAKLSPVQLAALKEERRQKLAKRRGIRRKRELTMLGKPKRPRSAFNIFMAEHFEEAKGITAQAKMKELFEGWQNLQSTQKKIYMQLAEDDKIRYENEIKSWEEQMVELGREDLIRVKQQRKAGKGKKVKGSKTGVRVISTKAKRPMKSTESNKSTSSETSKSVRRTKKDEE